MKCTYSSGKQTLATSRSDSVTVHHKSCTHGLCSLCLVAVWCQLILPMKKSKTFNKPKIIHYLSLFIMPLECLCMLVVRKYVNLIHLCAEMFWRNMTIVIFTFPNTGMALIVEIVTHRRQGPDELISSYIVAAEGLVTETRAPFQCPIRCLTVRSREVSKPRDWYFRLSYRFEIWQTHRQQCCRSACQISERSDNSKCKSRGFETSRDLTIRRPFGYWNGVQDTSSDRFDSSNWLFWFWFSYVHRAYVIYVVY